jgi:hypothetical protein
MTEDEYTLLRAQLERVGDDINRKFALDELLRIQRLFLDELWTMQSQVERMTKHTYGPQDVLLDVLKTMQRRIESRHEEERHD